MSGKIMIIESNLSTAKQISSHLREHDFETRVFLDGESALHEWNTYEPDLLLLEMNLPGMDGIAVCREIRRISSVPLIFISSECSIEKKVEALELGADDYITKPFDLREVLARIHAACRRSLGMVQLPEAASEYTGDYVEYPGLFINQTSYTVRYDDKELTLPPKELELLYCLASSPNRVFTREQLLDYVWGYDYIGDPRTVDVHIKRLRSKIKDHETWALTTVWGVGYKFTAEGPSK